MNFEDVRAIGREFPSVEEHLVFGGITLKVGKRYLTSIAKIDPDTLIMKVPDPLEREFLLTTKPDIYYMQDHYASFECVLIRMTLADLDEVRDLFEQAWRAYAPKRIVATYQGSDKSLP